MWILLAALGVFLLSASPAWAYLDPGTGSLLLQGIIAALAALSVSISMGWRHIKTIFARMCSRLGKRPRQP